MDEVKEIKSKQQLIAKDKFNTAIEQTTFLKEFQDDQIKDMQAFQFTLTCEKGKS